MVSDDHISLSEIIYHKAELRSLIGMKTVLEKCSDKIYWVIAELCGSKYLILYSMLLHSFGCNAFI